MSPHLPDPRAGIEPAASTFRAWRSYQQLLPRSQFIQRFGKEDSNLHHLIQSQGACRLADSRERPAGVEPAYRAWEARAWPIGQGRTDALFTFSRGRPRRPGSPPGDAADPFHVFTWKAPGRATSWDRTAGSGIRTPVAWVETRNLATRPIPPRSLPILRLSAEGEGVEPPRLIARPNSSRVPSPIGLSFLHRR